MAGIGEPDTAACEEAEKFANQMLKRLEKYMQGREWLANDRESIADHFALAYMEQVRDIDFPLDAYPQVKAWFKRVDGLDSSARARARLPAT